MGARDDATPPLALIDRTRRYHIGSTEEHDDQTTAKDALRVLARLQSEKHSDRWLLEVLDRAPSKEEVVEQAPSADEVIAAQPSVDEILGRDT